MWTKDDYQEHMLSYLGEVRAEIERLPDSSLQEHDLNELLADLDIASELLWWLIRSSDADWEGIRSPLEASCDALLHIFYRVPSPGTTVHPTSRNKWNLSRQRAERQLT
jgi:hypothetical protein